MNEILLDILSVVVTGVFVPLITWGGAELIRLIRAKVKSEKAAECLSQATSVVTSAVKAVFQTYVESLKASGSFGAEAQAEALSKAKDMAKSQISENVKSYISSNFGDLDAWLVSQIESTINREKRGES